MKISEGLLKEIAYQIKFHRKSFPTVYYMCDSNENRIRYEHSNITVHKKILASITGKPLYRLYSACGLCFLCIFLEGSLDLVTIENLEEIKTMLQ